MGFETLAARVPGGGIFATRRGMGEGPPVLLLHDGPGIGAEYMVGLVEELDGLIDGVLPQQRNLEPSTLAAPRDIETHVADAIAVLDHLEWERAWLLGHAWGGHLAMHIAVAHPERTAGLILIGTLGGMRDGGAAELVTNMVTRLTGDEWTRCVHHVRQFYTRSIRISTRPRYVTERVTAIDRLRDRDVQSPFCASASPRAFSRPMSRSPRAVARHES
jgi:pimeloyl-ACP methyl ester carboxylesterase